MICHYFPETTYFIIADGVPELLYYSHIPVMVVALLVGLFVFVNQPKQLLNRLLFIISILFSTWVFINLIAWTNIHGDFLLFVWPFFSVLSALLAFFSIYFVHVFAHKEDLPFKVKLLFTVLLAPVLIFAATDLSVSGFNISDCDAFGFEGELYNIYYTALGYLAIAWVAITLILKYLTAEEKFKKQIVLMGVGVEFFLFTFFTFVYIASYLANIGHFENSDLEFYGLFGMAFFMVMMGVLIVRFRTFNVGTLAANALVIALLILVGSQFTYTNSITATVLTSITLILTASTGIILMRSVRKEIEQRQQLEKLTTDLAKANKRLKKLDKLKSEFVSIASHQLRSPLTSIRGYASMLAEESFGKLPAKAKEPIERIAESARLMAVAVEDYLNVSRIESGNMKYNLSDFSLKDEVEKITDDVRPIAIKEGLVLLFRNKLNSKGIVNADIGKVHQIIHNLINNSIKYTPKGSITVLLRDDVDAKKIYLDIIDTGIGMSEETLGKVFEKFERADNANSVNVSGTGLGMFVALKMASAMKGNITATSEGDDKGSIFTLELPLVA